MTYEVKRGGGCTDEVGVPAPDRSRMIAWAAGGLAVLVVLGVGLSVLRWAARPHGPSTGLQATTRLNVEYPPTVEGTPLNSSVTQILNNQMASLKARVPALALTDEVQYQALGGAADVIIAGGPLPAALRFRGNAAQAKLLNQIGPQISGSQGRRPDGWGPKPTGALGGQMWCGTQPVEKSKVGLCYVVDSQNVLIITAFGDNALTDAEQVRAQVEVPAR
jgi:hypothetical protein